jgi:hypothetical protein
LEVTDGFYQWVGLSGLKRQRVDVRANDVGLNLPGNPVVGNRNKWVPSGEPSPMYLMMDRPIICNPADLATLTQRLPATPSEEAINPVLYSDNPFQRGIVHKQGATPYCNARESFTMPGFRSADLQGAYALGEQGLSSLLDSGAQEEEACDPWTLWAQASAGKGITTQQVITMIYNSTVFIAMAVGAYLAFAAVLRMYDVEYAELASNIGKLSGVFFKNLHGKAVALQNKAATMQKTSIIPQGITATTNLTKTT